MRTTKYHRVVRRSLLIVLLVACGRVGFDPVSTTDTGALTYSRVVLADRPVGYWRLADPANLVDEIGGTSGFSLGGCTATSGALTGDPDGAIDFDGSCVLDLGPGTPFLGQAPFTVEAWIKSSATGVYEHIVTRQLRDAADPLEGYALLDGPSGAYFERVINGAPGSFTTRAPIPTSVVTHVAGVFDGVRGAIYLDGVQVGVSPVDTSIAVPHTATILIGAALRDDGSYQGLFFGTIDEVAVYDYALTPAQLLLHHQIGSNGPSP